MALYNEVRPAKFADVKGQPPVVLLQKSLARGKAAQAYLFTGVRGTGKTTTARILAAALNCEHKTDGEPCGECEACLDIRAGRSASVFELDAARNRGVDSANALIENTKFPPIKGRKVFIIDEVHMFTTEAFNALLKTIEEPPAWCTFILCTTEVHKVPATIASRCQRFHFAAIGEETIASRLMEVACEHSIKVEADAIYMIAGAAKGAMRDGLSLFEQVADAGDVTVAAVTDLLGIDETEEMQELVFSILAGDEAVFGTLRKLSADGRNFGSFIDSLQRTLTDMVLYASSDKAVLHGTDSYKEFVSKAADSFEVQDIFSVLSVVTSARSRAEREVDPWLYLGVTLLSDMRKRQKEERTEERLNALESGRGAAAPAAPQTEIPEEEYDEPEDVPEGFETASDVPFDGAHVVSPGQNGGFDFGALVNLAGMGGNGGSPSDDAVKSDKDTGGVGQSSGKPGKDDGDEVVFAWDWN